MTEKKSHGQSKAGVELTDDVLDRMAAEAEAGLNIRKLRRRPGRPSMGSGPAGTFPVRLEPELRGAMEDRAAADQTTASDVVREALRRYLKVGTLSQSGTQHPVGENEPLIGAHFEIYKDGAGGYRWRLHANNYEVVADSPEGYTSKSDCLRAVDALRQSFASARVSDLSDSRTM